MDSGSFGSSLTKTQRLILGSFVLILVDVIWVASSELTKFIYSNETFEKPFFCTYVKTSMFAIYLLGFLFWQPWKDNCSRPANYIHVDTEQEDENYYNDTNTTNSRLSNPVYVPVKTPELDRNSGTESDDSSVRSVRFNKLAEVRHMSETDATEALLARLSYQATLRAGEIAKRAAIKLPVLRVAKISLIFCLLWFLANYSYQVALAQTEAAMVNVLSSTSSFFTLVLAAIFPSNQNDKFTLSKFLAVLLSLLGTTLVSFSDISLESSVPLGAFLSLLSAFFYATYLVFLKRKVDHEDKIDIPLFFGFVGFFNLILLWPCFFFLHFSGLEVFEWPSRQQVLLLLLNGVLGTVISEALWLWGCFLTSSLMATMSMSLTIPMTMLMDVFLKKIVYPSLFYTGSIPMVVAFFAVTLLSHYDNWDPVLDVIRCAYLSICRRTRFMRFAEMPSEQTEALIGINSNEHEA
ncbi:solute carrier family 35, member F5 [Tribolium castaneum]|uniref:Solute carrier family 35 member F5 n=1 Tax=Tribolium castaneum TaxID=7070 RepID=D6WTY2_TRICA|nr:solute carrier family 35, member F5 [Tribolium castaneum]EFA07349.1 Solute carrier family 35 member F5-like Protein [Tribolium castaneum]|eukprot:NP_001164081.1 solute carrier family 35, member F5 [Tribolium castaneum]